MSQKMKQVLLSKQTSRSNKLALVAQYQLEGAFVEWRWDGQPNKSRLLFRFGPEESFVPAKSYEDDVVPTLILNEGKKA